MRLFSVLLFLPAFLGASAFAQQPDSVERPTARQAVVKYFEAQRLAETGQPLLQTRQATADAAREAAIAARQLPDPKLRLGIQNLPVEGPEAYTIGQDSMTMRMVGVMQEFPRQAKRELRSEVVLLEGERSERELAFARLQVRRDAALAWLEKN